MQLFQLLNEHRVLIDTCSHSKTAVLAKISQLFSDDFPQLNAKDLFEAYWHRESLGSTTLGHGLLIPHVRSSFIDAPAACFIRLQRPVDFGAEDKQPVDLVIGLLGPEQHPEKHLKVLAAIVKQVSSEAFRDQCRSASSSDELIQVLKQLHAGS
ncbi:Nitrogen regulatory protein [Legionella rubrilucens]|uniref:Nitrogen regulatory protein n=1 Tax=Legionella rubrilucens TaxID=458 RepID=A0A0W0XVY5_9GAMM|nr:PTS sugar transporter subunit IIA [Legionella rubrilucens]KTD48494.1 Nitrogen regulatory protein [Legionella rubrilucens]